MTDFRKALHSLVHSSMPDDVVKELLREMLCPDNEFKSTDLYRRHYQPSYGMAIDGYGGLQ